MADVANDRRPDDLGHSGDDYKAKKLLDSGAITQAEFDAIKTKALE